jgi:hypothetical protein
MNPDSQLLRLGVIAERRRGVTQWAEHVWRVVEVLEETPEVEPWTLLRQEEDGRTLFFAGQAEAALHPTDTANYKHNLEAAQPLVWAVLRPADTPSGFRLQGVTVDPGEAHLHADVGNDLVESLPMPPRLRATVESFVARHHKERGFWKRKRDQADPEALARQARGGGTEE